MAITPTDLYAFGNRAGPTPPRPGRDCFPDAGGMIEPNSKAPWHGKSTFASLDHVSLTGHYHKLPQGTILPEGLEVVPDGRDVDPGSPLEESHHTIIATRRMHMSEYVGLIMGLPWQYGGKK